MINENDKALLAAKGITEEKLHQQLECFQKGFPFLRLHAAAGIGKGILQPSETDAEAYLKAWDAYTDDASHRIVKFVPASGAASRMFKNMFAFADADYDAPQTDFEKTFFEKIHSAAFFQDLNDACLRLHGKDIDALLAEGAYKPS